MITLDSPQGIQALAEGWVIADTNPVVQPSDVQPGGTIHITAHFKNTATYLPAFATLQVKLDGLVIWEWSGLFEWGGKEEGVDIDFTLPSSTSTGAHRITAQESDQGTNIPYTDFTVSAPPPPGKRNVSFSSIPAGAQVYIGSAYHGDTPITIPISPGTYVVKAVYSGQEVSRNIQVVSGSGTLSVEFTFTQEPAFDLTKFLEENRWYIGGGIAALALLYLAVKQPATVKRGLSVAQEYAGKGYQKAKEVYKGAII